MLAEVMTARMISSLFLLMAASCQTPYDDGVKLPLSEATQMQSRGEFLAEALCSGCHAIADGEVSPNPEAPTFVEISDRDGLTRETLGDFLHDSYNFPGQMNLEVSDEDADAIAAYILTLRSADD